MPHALPNFPAGFIAAYLVFILVVLVVSLIANWKIAVKSGFGGPLSLLMLIPLVNIVIFLMFAFTEWPMERELRAARRLDAPAP